jgi:hypothetical protein
MRPTLLSELNITTAYAFLVVSKRTQDEGGMIVYPTGVGEQGLKASGPAS